MILDKQLSIYLKGIAIILMVFGHSFGSPQWYVETVSYPDLLPYMRIISRFFHFGVVPTFLFLTGYSYYVHNDKSIKYSLKKILIFLVDYWIVYSVLGFIAWHFCDLRISFVAAIKEMFSITNNVMCFNWYVFLYIELMIILPMVHRIVENFGVKKAIIFLVVIFASVKFVCVIISSYGLRDAFYFKALNVYLIRHIPVAIGGYFVAKFNLLERIYVYVRNLNKLQILGGLVLLIVLNHISTKFGLIYVTVYIVLLYSLKINYTNIFNEIVLFLAKHSMNIWFIHCLFYAKATKEYFQQYAFISDNPILVVAWILFLCTCVSVLITPMQNIINKKIKEIIA